MAWSQGAPLLAAAILCQILMGPLPAPALAQKLFRVNASKFLMGTEVEVIALYPSVSECRNHLFAAFREIERVEALLSSHRDDSDISRINRNAGGRPVKISGETLAILKRAQGYAAKLDGLFDVTVGPVIEAWGFNTDREIAIPSKAVLAQSLALVDYRRLRLNSADTTAALHTPGMRIDLGGIAKGYAIDRAKAVLEERGVMSFLINAGGDIYARGVKEGGKLWTVGIKHPRRLTELLAVFKLRDFAVATSGDYERYADIDGKRYHHIINPKTGYPADLCQSVTVLAPTAEEADVWATYLFIIGPDTFKSRFPRPPHEVLFVDANGRVHFDERLRTLRGLEFLNADDLTEAERF